MKPTKAKINLPVNELGEVAYIGTTIEFLLFGRGVQDRVDGYIQKPGSSTMLPHCEKTGETPSEWAYPINDKDEECGPYVNLPLDRNGSIIFPDSKIKFDRKEYDVERLELIQMPNHWRVYSPDKWITINLKSGINNHVTVIPTE